MYRIDSLSFSSNWPVTNSHLIYGLLLNGTYLSQVLNFSTFPSLPTRQATMILSVIPNSHMSNLKTTAFLEEIIHHSNYIFRCPSKGHWKVYKNIQRSDFLNLNICNLGSRIPILDAEIL